MPGHSGFSKVNRRSHRVSRIVGAGLMLTPSVLLLLAALHTPEIAPLGTARALPTISRATLFAQPFGCRALALPHDAALGNAGGDPYAFYEFDRSEQLAALQRQADKCRSAASTP